MCVCWWTTGDDYFDKSRALDRAEPIACKRCESGHVDENHVDESGHVSGHVDEKRQEKGSGLPHPCTPLEAEVQHTKQFKLLREWQLELAIQLIDPFAQQEDKIGLDTFDSDEAFQRTVLSDSPQTKAAIVGDKYSATLKPPLLEQLPPAGIELSRPFITSSLGFPKDLNMRDSEAAGQGAHRLEREGTGRARHSSALDPEAGCAQAHRREATLRPQVMCDLESGLPLVRGGRREEEDRELAVGGIPGRTMSLQSGEEQLLDMARETRFRYFKDKVGADHVLLLA